MNTETSSAIKDWLPLVTFILAWVISPLLKQAGVNARVETMCKEIQELKTKDIKEIKDDISELKERAAWQEKADYILSAQTAALEKLSNGIEKLTATVFTLDGKQSIVAAQASKAEADAVTAQRTADKANKRIDELVIGGNFTGNRSHE